MWQNMPISWLLSLYKITSKIKHLKTYSEASSHLETIFYMLINVYHSIDIEGQMNGC